MWLERLWIFGSGSLPTDPEYLWRYHTITPLSPEQWIAERFSFLEWLKERRKQGAYARRS
jgi:hypothetical protein